MKLENVRYNPGSFERGQGFEGWEIGLRSLFVKGDFDERKNKQVDVLCFDEDVFSMRVSLEKSRGEEVWPGMELRIVDYTKRFPVEMVCDAKSGEVKKLYVGVEGVKMSDENGVREGLLYYEYDLGTNRVSAFFRSLGSSQYKMRISDSEVDNCCADIEESPRVMVNIDKENGEEFDWFVAEILDGNVDEDQRLRVRLTREGSECLIDCGGLEGIVELAGAMLLVRRNGMVEEELNENLIETINIKLNEISELISQEEVRVV